MYEDKENLMAYVAGVLDGDGSFSIIKFKGKKSPWFIPMLQFANLSKEITRILSNELGGKTRVRAPYLLKSGTTTSALHCWILRGAQGCSKALEKITKYLVIKKERAEYLLSYIKQHSFKKGVIMTDDEITERAKKHLHMISLNDCRKPKPISSKLAAKINECPKFWAYLAGIMDTDGSFCVKRQTKNGATPGVKNHRYSCVIQVSFAGCDAINFLRKGLPFGKSYIAKNKAMYNGFHYTWNISSKEDAIEFLQRIIPYLVHKKENAKVLLKFCKGFERTKSCIKGISAEQLQFRESCYQELVKLNKWGL